MASTRQLVTSVSVSPLFGIRTCAVSWELLPEVTGASVFVYRSDDNGANWKCLNIQSPVTSGNAFLDDTLPTADTFSALCWRLLVLYKGVPHPTQPVGMYAALTRREWAAARAMVITELRLLSAGRKGLPAFYLSPRITGELSPAYDPDTDTVSGACSPGTAGMPFEGGFNPPWQTWVGIKPASPMVTERGQDGAGWNRSHAVQLRLPAWPVPVSGGMVVFPTLGERYAIGAEITPYRFKGQAPIVWAAAAELIPRSDRRWEIPVPALADDNHIPFLINPPEASPT